MFYVFLEESLRLPGRKSGRSCWGNGILPAEFPFHGLKRINHGVERTNSIVECINHNVERRFRQQVRTFCVGKAAFPGGGFKTSVRRRIRRAGGNGRLFFF